MTHAEDVRTVERDGEDAPTEPGLDCKVTAHSCSPERTVFTEDGNTDAWIATDTTVDLHQ